MAVAEALESVKEDEFFYMANLFPRITGLPFIVWVSTGTGAKHDMRVKVSRGPKVQSSEFIIVGLRPHVHVIHGFLSLMELAQLAQWIKANYEAIRQYWEEEIDTAELLGKLQRLPRD
jgi:hypothetical protein